MRLSEPIPVQDQRPIADEDRTFYYKYGDMVKVRVRSRPFFDIAPLGGENALRHHNLHKDPRRGELPAERTHWHHNLPI